MGLVERVKLLSVLFNDKMEKSIDELTLDEIFEGMTAAFDPQAAGNWDTLIQFNILSGGESKKYNMTIKNGTCTLSKGEAEGVKLTITMEEKDFRAIIKGDLRGEVAYMTGKLRARGNMNDLMRLGSVFKKK
ncbi:MAG: SCP2 sterol-binding domain-containing protein [Thermoproteota archaeon]